MAKKPDVKKIVLAVLARLALICATVFVAALYELTSLEILEKYLGYKNSSGFFWGGSLVDEMTAWLLGLSLFSGVFFGALGKRWDYIVIILFITFSVYGYYGTENVTSLMFVGLGIAALLGNAIGFGLKLLRKKYFPKFDI